MTQLEHHITQRWPEGRPADLGPRQLEWCRKTWRKFRRWERGVKRMIRETEQSRLVMLAEIECQPNDRSRP